MLLDPGRYHKSAVRIQPTARAVGWASLEEDQAPKGRKRRTVRRPGQPSHRRHQLIPRRPRFHNPPGMFARTFEEASRATVGHPDPGIHTLNILTRHPVHLPFSTGPGKLCSHISHPVKPRSTQQKSPNPFCFVASARPVRTYLYSKQYFVRPLFAILRPGAHSFASMNERVSSKPRTNSTLTASKYYPPRRHIHSWRPHQSAPPCKEPTNSPALPDSRESLPSNKRPPHSPADCRPSPY